MTESNRFRAVIKENIAQAQTSLEDKFKNDISKFNSKLSSAIYEMKAD